MARSHHRISYHFQRLLENLGDDGGIGGGEAARNTPIFPHLLRE
jgi:hypothetical protein